MKAQAESADGKNCPSVDIFFPSRFAAWACRQRHTDLFLLSNGGSQ